MTRQGADSTSIPSTTRHLSSATPTMRLRNGRQRQVDELYDLYDTVMIESLLKRHPSLNKFSGA